MELSNKERKKNMSKYYDVPIEDFEHRFPWLFKRMTSFEEIDDYMVFIDLNDGRTLLYDIFIHEFKEVKRFDDVFELTEDEWKLGFSHLLAKRIQMRRMTQYELANKLGVSEMTISRYITGKSLPSVYMMNKITKVLKCSQEDLFPHDYIILK